MSKPRQAAHVLESLFPRSVSVAVWHGGREVPQLFPEEQSAISNSVQKRYVEFARGRACDVPPPAVPLAMLDLKPLAVPGAEAF